MEIFHLQDEAGRLERSDGDIGHRILVDRPGYRAGVVQFRRQGETGSEPGPSKEITHTDLDVMVHVIGGDGSLTVFGEARTVVPGMFLHLPAGTPHDFSAGENDLLLLYTQIERSSG